MIIIRPIIFLSLLCIGCQARSGETGSEVPLKENLMDFQNRLDQLVPIKTIAGLAGEKESALSLHYDRTDENPALHTYVSGWSNGQTTTIQTSDGKISLPLTSILGFGQIYASTKEMFEEKYRQKSGAEIREQLTIMAKDTTIAPDMAIWEMREIASQAKKTRFQKLEGPGELMVWETPANALHVFSKGTAFTVFSNTGDMEINRKNAMKLASVILKNSEP